MPHHIRATMDSPLVAFLFPLGGIRASKTGQQHSQNPETIDNNRWVTIGHSPQNQLEPFTYDGGNYDTTSHIYRILILGLSSFLTGNSGIFGTFHFPSTHLPTTFSHLSFYDAQFDAQLERTYHYYLQLERNCYEC